MASIWTTKMLIESWISDQLLHEDLKQINSKLQSIRFPVGCLRKMRNLETKDKLKAADYENFPFYGFVVVREHMEKQMFDNFAKLSQAISA